MHTGDVDVALLLHELCAKLGVCLPQHEQDALIADPPADVDDFVTAVLRADGGEPEATDLRLARRVRVMVDGHLRDPADPPSPGPAFDAWPLLYDVCVRLGYCLPPEQWDALMADPPLDVDAFAEAIFIGEGMESPREADTHTWRTVRALVEQHFRTEGVQA
ncbi:hypothetical protein acdb102_26780 [Acidothermaceae bacterium B102]|nr:hypothetical protein acdb102_26780 [Acidothermaceae bacterium B102]